MSDGLPPPPAPADPAPSDRAGHTLGAPAAGPPDLAGSPAPPPAPRHATPLAPGEMTASWRLMLGATWVTALFAYAAVWQASVSLGIATWWVGPRSQPTSPFVKMIPFALVIAAILPLAYNLRNPHRVALTLSVGAALVAVPDFSRSTGLAVVELLIAAALALVSAAAATGVARVRPAPPR